MFLAVGSHVVCIMHAYDDAHIYGRRSLQASKHGCKQCTILNIQKESASQMFYEVLCLKDIYSVF